MYYLKYDKPGLSPFCFSGPGIRKCVPLFDACRQQQPEVGLLMLGNTNSKSVKEYPISVTCYIV